MDEVWAEGAAYEWYMGRWSAVAAARFVAWLALPERGTWLDVGCGAGALSAALAARSPAARLVSLDRSPGFVRTTRAGRGGGAREVLVADAARLPVADGSADGVVSGLVLNFLADPLAGVTELARVCRPGGTVAAYVWDYARGMPMLSHFWAAAVDRDPGAAALDEATRFGLCEPEGLRALWGDAGLTGAEVVALEVPMVFADLADYWEPFLGGQGPAPTYVAALSESDRGELRDALRRRLPLRRDGSIDLTARAWAVRGTRP